MMRRLAWVLLLLSAAPAMAAPHELQIPLRDGKVQVGDLTAALCREMHLPDCRLRGQINLNGVRGSEFISALNASLGDGCRLTVAANSAVLHIDPQKLPHSCLAMKRVVRVFTAQMTPEATAEQQKNWGLFLPDKVDASRPLVVLIHGLDADRGDCQPMGDLLQHEGFQVAYFCYPGAQPIAESASLLGRHMASLHERFPRMRVNVIAHSMGGLVAREYIEGPDYAGGVSRLIMIAPPNGGSSWARLQFLLGLEEHYHLRQNNPHWRWSWTITDGFGEAGDNLLPGSDFLKKLNSRPRQPGVIYTIVAGCRSGVGRVEAEKIEKVAGWMPERARTWWGFRHCQNGLQAASAHFRNETGSSDGPVAVESTKLAGVDDFVLLPADHMSLYLPVNGQNPAAWDIIRDRLGR